MIKQKNIAMILLMIILMMTFSTIAVFADEGEKDIANDIGDVNVKMTVDPTTGEASIDMGLGFNEADGTQEVWSQIFIKYKAVIVGFTGIAMLTSIIIFIVKFMQLQASSGNPTAKAQALQGLLWTGLATAGIGSVTVIVGFFYYAL